MNAHKPLAGKKVAVLVETEYIYDEIEYYKKHVAELGGELHLLSYLWGQPSKDFVNDIDNPDNPVTSVHRLTVTKCVTQVEPSDYDLIICAANYVAVRLREIPPMGSLGSIEEMQDAPAVRFFARAMQDTRIIKGAMCHALWILTPTKLLHGRKVICHTVVLADIHNAGGIYVPAESHVVVDGDLVTARSFKDVEGYFAALVKAVGTQSAARPAVSERPAARPLKRVLVAASNYGFWGEELQAPWDALNFAGHQVTLATPQGKKPLPIDISVDPNFFDPIQKYHVNPPEVCRRVKALLTTGDWDAPLKLAEVAMASYDALVLTGGPGADLDLTNNPAVHRLVLEALQQGKLVAAMCFSVAALAFTRDPNNNYRSVVWGKTVTAHPRTWDFLGDLSYGLYQATSTDGTNVVTPGFLLPLQDIMEDAVGLHGRCIADATTSRAKPSTAWDGQIVTGCSVESSIAFGNKIVEALVAVGPASSCFPEPTEQEFNGLQQRVYAREDVQVLFTPVGIGGSIPIHHHVAAQIGMCEEGRYRMECDGTREEIQPLTNACYVRPNVLHGAPEPSSVPYVSLDIKSVLGPRCVDGPAGFLHAGPDTLPLA